MHLLIVDDDDSIRMALSRGLRMHGHLAAEVGTLAEALPMIPYVDAAICDGLDGGCWAVESACAAAGKAFVLLRGDEDLLDRAREFGIPCMRKPAGMTEILGALRIAEEVTA